MSAPKSLNPIIGDTPAETLFSLMCVLAFLRRYEDDMADIAMQSSASGSSFDTELSSNEHRGLSVLLACAEAATWFELEGRE